MSGGAAAGFLQIKEKDLRLPLVFAGAFLFALTVIHILPELFTFSGNAFGIGIWILVGFFLQQILEKFTSGIEHGHFHVHASGNNVGLLIALMIHSILEGALLTHDSPFHERHESYSLLLGIVLHKGPAAFALMSVVKNGRSLGVSAWVILVLFSLASPLGLVVSGYVLTISPQHLAILFALVSGIFLHISTTIFVETNPEHRFGWKSIVISVLGALVAVIAEYAI